MRVIAAIGALSIGAVIGWLVRYFIRRFHSLGCFSAARGSPVRMTSSSETETRILKFAGTAVLSVWEHGKLQESSYHLAACLFLLALAGCAASGPPFSRASDPNPPEALVYVYRGANQISSGVQATFTLDGKKFLETYQMGYTHFYVPEGKHVLGAWYGTEASRPLRITADFAGGKTYYVKLDITNVRRAGSTTYYDKVLRLVPASEALNELRNYKFQVNSLTVKEAPR